MDAEWKVVRRKNRRRGKPITERKGCDDECIGMIENDVVERNFISNPMERSSLIKEVRRLQEAIEASVWGKYVLSAVRDVIEAKQGCRLVGGYKSGVLGSVTCYGLGRFGETFSHVPKHQLALVLALRKYIGSSSPYLGRKGEVISAYAYDPISTPLEMSALRELEIENCECDEQGKRPVPDDGAVHLFFMPHCPMRLYSNVLWANWSKDALSRVLILGNSLSEYDITLMKRSARNDPTNCVLKVLGVLTEVILDPNALKAKNNILHTELTHMKESFNDLALCYFENEALRSTEGQTLFNTPRPPEI